MASNRTSEASGEGGFSDGMGVREGETDLAVGCGDGVRVGMGEGGTSVAIGCGDGVKVDEGGAVVCAGRRRLAEQLVTRLIPIVVISVMRVRRIRNRTRRRRLLFTSELGMETYTLGGISTMASRLYPTTRRLFRQVLHSLKLFGLGACVSPLVFALMAVYILPLTGIDNWKLRKPSDTIV